MQYKKLLLLLSFLAHGAMYAAAGRAGAVAGRAGTVAVGAMRGQGLPLWRATAGHGGAFDSALFGLTAHGPIVRESYDALASRPEIFDRAAVFPGGPVSPVIAGRAQGGGAIGERADIVEPAKRGPGRPRKEVIVRTQEQQAEWNKAAEQSAKAVRARRRQEALAKKEAEKAEQKPVSTPAKRTGSIFDQASRVSTIDDITGRMVVPVKRPGVPSTEVVPVSERGIEELEEIDSEIERAAGVPLPPMNEEELAEWEVLYPADSELSEISGQLPGPVIDAEFEEIFPEDVGVIEPFESAEAQESLGDSGVGGQITDGSRIVSEEVERVPVSGAHEIRPDRFEVTEQQASEIESAQPEQILPFTIPGERGVIPVRPERPERSRQQSDTGVQTRVPQIGGRVIDAEYRVIEEPRTEPVAVAPVRRDGPTLPVISNPVGAITPQRRGDKRTQRTTSNTEPEASRPSAIISRSESLPPAVIPTRPTEIARVSEPIVQVPGVQVPGVNRPSQEVQRTDLEIEEFVPQDVGPARPVEVVERESVLQDTITPTRRRDRETGSGVVAQNQQSVTQEQAGRIAQQAERDRLGQLSRQAREEQRAAQEIERVETIAQRRAQIEREMSEIEARMNRVRAQQAEEKAADPEAVARVRREAQERLDEARRMGEQNRRFREEQEQIERDAVVRQAAEKQALEAEEQGQAELARRRIDVRRAVQREAEEAATRRAEQAEREAAARRAEEEAVARRATEIAEAEAAAQRRAVQEAAEARAAQAAVEETAARNIQRAMRSSRERANRAARRTAAPRRAERNQSRTPRRQLPGRVIDAEYRAVDRRPVVRPRVPRRPVNRRVRPEEFAADAAAMRGVPGVIPAMGFVVPPAVPFDIPHADDTRPAFIPRTRPWRFRPFVPEPEVPVATESGPAGSNLAEKNPNTTPSASQNWNIPGVDIPKRPFAGTDGYEEPQPIFDDTPQTKPEEESEWYPEETMPELEAPFIEPQDRGGQQEQQRKGPDGFIVKPEQGAITIEFPDKKKEEKDTHFVGMQSAKEDRQLQKGSSWVPAKKIKNTTVTVVQEPQTEYEEENILVRVGQWVGTTLAFMILLYLLRRRFW